MKEGICKNKSYPEFNIWKENVLNSKLYVDEKDYDKEKSSKLRNLFLERQVLGNASTLLEKLPINNFRLKILQKSFQKLKNTSIWQKRIRGKLNQLKKKYKKTTGLLAVN